MALHATGNWKTRWVSPPRLQWKAVRARCDCGDLRCCKNTSALDSFDIWKKFVAERKAQSTSIQNGQNPLDTSDQTETETKKSSANKKAVESHGIGSPWRVPIRGRPFSFNISFQLMWSFKKTALQPVLNHERWWPIQIPLNGQHFWNAQCLEKKPPAVTAFKATTGTSQKSDRPKIRGLGSLYQFTSTLSPIHFKNSPNESPQYFRGKMNKMNETNFDFCSTSLDVPRAPESLRQSWPPSPGHRWNLHSPGASLRPKH